MKNFSNIKEELHTNTAEALEDLKERKARLTSDIEASAKSGDTDDPFDKAVYDPLSMALAHFFIKLGWSANVVTLSSLFFGVAGSLFFYPQNRLLNLIGVLLEFFAAVLDCSDGQVARLTHTSSEFGRVLDGVVDICNFLSVYIVLALRMSKEIIPFTDLKWGAYIWPVFFIVALFHAGQARMADYFRGLHLYFVNNEKTTAFTNSESIKGEMKKTDNVFHRFVLFVYLIYTGMQEKRTPKMQVLLRSVNKCGMPDGLPEAYRQESLKYIQLTNLLTFNLRAYTLYFLILLGLHPWYFPFEIFVMEAIKVYMVRSYEKAAEKLHRDFFENGQPGAVK